MENLKVKLNAQVISFHNDIATIAMFIDDELSNIFTLKITEYPGHFN